MKKKMLVKLLVGIMSLSMIAPYAAYAAEDVDNNEELIIEDDTYFDEDDDSYFDDENDYEDLEVVEDSNLVAPQAMGGGGNNTKPTESTSYEWYIVNVVDEDGNTLATSGTVSGSAGADAWLAGGTYTCSVSLADGGKSIYYGFVNNGKTTQSGTLALNIPADYYAVDFTSYVVTGTNSASESYDNATVTVTVTKLRTPSGETQTKVNGDVTVLLRDEEGGYTTLDTFTLFTNVNVLDKQTYSVNPEDYYNANDYDYIGLADNSNALSGIIDSDKHVILVVERILRHTISITVIDNDNNEVISTSVLNDSIRHKDNYSYDPLNYVPEHYTFVRSEGEFDAVALDDVNLEVYVSKEKVPVSLVVNYYDENGEVIKDHYSESSEIAYGEEWSYTVAVPEIEGYFYEFADTDLSYTNLEVTEAVNNVINLRYGTEHTGTLTINYYDADTNEFIKTIYTTNNAWRTATKPENCSNPLEYNFQYSNTNDASGVSFEAILCINYGSFESCCLDDIVDGYNIVYSIPDSATQNGEFVDGDTVIDLYIAKSEYTASVTINFVDIFGNTIKESITTTSSVLSSSETYSYEVNPADYSIDGYFYEYAEGDDLISTLTSNNHNAVITLVYRDLKDVSVTVNYYDIETGAKLLDSVYVEDTFEYYFKYPISIPEITGYDIVSCIDEAGVLTGSEYNLIIIEVAGDYVVDLYYTRETYNVELTINYVDEKGNKLTESSVISDTFKYNDSWSYEVEKKDFAGYTYTENIEDFTFTTSTPGEYEITLVYNLDYTVTVVLDWINLTDNTNLINTEEITGTYHYSDEFTLTLDDYEEFFLPNYEFDHVDGDLAYSFNVTEDFSTHVIYYYRTVTHNVSVDIDYYALNGGFNYDNFFSCPLTVDELINSGIKVKDSDNESGNFRHGDPFTMNVATPEIFGYSFVEVMDGEMNYDFEVTEDYSDRNVLYYAPWALFVRVTDTEGIVLRDWEVDCVSTEADVNAGEYVNYVIHNDDERIPEGYTLVRFDGDTPEGELDGFKYVTIVVEKITHTVTVVVEDTDGNELAGDTNEGKYGDTYEVITDNYIPEDYKLVRVDGDELSGILDSDKEIIIVVEKISHTITVIVTDKDGNELDTDTTEGKHGDEYSIVVNEYIPDGYELVEVDGNPSGTLDEDKVITIIVEKETHIITIIVTDEDGNFIDDDIIEGKDGDEYEINIDEYTPDGYEVIDVDGDTTGTLDEDKVITIVVKEPEKEIHTIIVNFYNEDGDPIANSYIEEVVDGDEYDISELIVAPEGYELDRTEGDEFKGIADSDKVIDVYCKLIPVEEEPTPTPEPEATPEVTPEPTPVEETTDVTAPVKTGDSTPIAIYTICLGAALAAIAGVASRKKK